MKKIYRAKQRFMFLLLGLCIGISQHAAYAAHLTVNSLADNVATDGACTLREAINNAQTDSDTTGGDCVAGSGADIITFSVSGTIVLNAGDPRGELLILDSAGLTIDGGSKITISGNNAARVFVVNADFGKGPGVLALQNLTVANGSIAGNSGGGLANDGMVTISNCTFSENRADNSGGAINNSKGATLTISNSTLSGNSAGSAFGFGGGAILNNGVLTITGSTLSGNSGGSGGAILHAVGLTDTNTRVTITNSTLAENSAVVGGAILNVGTMAITNSTLSGNSAHNGGGAIAQGEPGSVTVINSILANSPSGGNCTHIGRAAMVIDGGNNIADDGSCSFSTANNSKPSTDARLDPAGLQANGGPTETIALLDSSPAIDAIPVGTGGCGTTLMADQRGITRPKSSACDIGAFEFQPAPDQLQFSVSNYRYSEGIGQALITVTRTGGSIIPAAVTFTTVASNAPGAATEGADYLFTQGQLVFPPGNSVQSFPVIIKDDSAVEGDETVGLMLSNPTGGATLGAQSTAVLTIIDNDQRVPTPGVLQFSAPTFSVGEGAGSATITVTRSGGSDGAVSVNYATVASTAAGAATEGADYVATSGVVAFAAGDAAPKTFSVPIIDDTDVEDSETVMLTLSNPTNGATLGGTGTATLTIIDNDIRALQVAIDIVPGLASNPVVPGKGFVPVAILTDSYFDAGQIDAKSLRFGPAGAHALFGKGVAVDVDRDGDKDFVVAFKTSDTGIACGDTKATLTGKTFSGQAITGMGTIKTVGCNGK